MSVGASLTDLEEALTTLYFFNRASPSQDQKQLCIDWGITKYNCEVMLGKWSRLWEDKTKEYCLLDLRDDADFFKTQQPAGFQERYGCVISNELDGTTIKHDKSRRHSVKARSSYNDKTKHQACQGLTWTSAIGLVLLCTTVWCGRTSEKALVRLHKKWLTIFPR